MSKQHCFSGEHEACRKQRNFAPQNAIHFVSKLIIFQKVESESDTAENLGQLRSDSIKISRKKFALHTILHV